MSRPWFKFYPSAWRSEPALRMCCGAARALWIEMICVMHEAGGHFVVNGKQPSIKNLALMHGISIDECQALLVELEENGVFSRNDEGIIYSRRMVRDEAKAAQDKANGKMGGNPSVMQGVNPPPPPAVKAKILDTRDKSTESKEEKRTRARRALVPFPADYYPNATTRALAAKKGLSEEALEETTCAVREWALSKDERKADWDAAHQGWIRRDSGNRKVNYNGKSTVAAADRLIERIKGFNDDATRPIRPVLSIASG